MPGRCKNFGQLTLSLWDSRLEGWAGRDSRGGSPTILSLGKERILVVHQGPFNSKTLNFASLDLPFPS